MSMEIGYADKVRVVVLADDYAGYNSPFLAQHGVSYLIDVWSNNSFLRILFDTGTYAYPILFNMEKLGINPSSIDTIVLSHNHFDHTGGLYDIVKRIGKNDLPIIAHPMIFKQSFIVKPRLMNIGIPLKNPRKDIEEAGGQWFLSKMPLVLGEGVVTTGEISMEERESFEIYQIPNIYRLRDGELVADKIDDEIALVINMRKGIIVISGCSHSGIVSIVKKSVKLTQNNNVLAVIGGFHLINADEDRIMNTVEGLSELGVKNIYAGHCTGLRAEALLLTEFNNRFKKIYAGMIIEI